MDTSLFERYRKLIYDKSGIVLTPQKESLLLSRLQKRLRATGVADEASYLEIIETDLSGQELVQLLDAISTNTTYFWREPEHFEVFGKLSKEWSSEGVSSARIWCAASSTGQEPYTLAMQVIENFSPITHDVRVLATDVSTRVLNIALAGQYTDQEVSKLPSKLRDKYLSPLKTGSATNQASTWEVKSDLRRLVLYKKLNLVEFPYPLKGPLDIIFCRNVMIYFDTPTRQKIIAQYERLLRPGGYLFLSLSENLFGIEHRFEKVSASVFKLGSR